MSTATDAFKAVSGVLLIAAALACGRSPDLETRTYRLDHLEASQAAEMISPYVYENREDAPGRISTFDGGLTIRETEDNHSRISELLEEADRPRPVVRLRFQLIAADGGNGSDARIEEVVAVLRDLFRFENYELLEEVQMTGTEGAFLEQQVSVGQRSYRITGELDNVRVRRDSGSVELSVSLDGPTTPTGQDLFGTTVTLPLDQTVVVGSSRLDQQDEAIILTVRAASAGRGSASRSDR